jgi:uncharacterized membrane protein (UPF0127 family)
VRSLTQPSSAAGAPSGEILLSRTQEIDESLKPVEGATRDLAVAGFRQSISESLRDPAAAVGNRPSIAPLRLAGLADVPPQGACLVYSPATSGVIVAPALDAGSSLLLSGPGTSQALPLVEGQYRLESPPATPFLGPGEYILTGPGGPGFPGFSARVSIGEPVTWQSMSGAQEEVRSEGLDVRWEAPVDGPDWLLLIGRPAAGSGSPAPRPSFACSAAPASGALQVPPAVLANVPESSLGAELTSAWGPEPLAFDTDGPERGALLYAGSERSTLRLGSPHLPGTPVELPDGSEIQAELAATFSERQRGLMNRRSLDPRHGMLFLFESPGNYSFWMLNTLVPLDIVWMDSSGRIVFISANTPPCPASTICPTYGGQQTSQFVLELAAGQAAAHGLAVGDRLRW